jgi:hypothetical protein
MVIMVTELLDFQHMTGTNTAILRISLNTHGEFYSVRLPTQCITYSQRFFRPAFLKVGDATA